MTDEKSKIRNLTNIRKEDLKINFSSYNVITITKHVISSH